MSVEPGPVHRLQPESSKAQAGYWEQRLFKNTYTYQGKRFETKHWCIKIQHQGRRKTFALSAPDRSDAAIEARDLHSMLVGRGWEAVEEMRNDRPAHSFNSQHTRVDSYGTAAFWRPRLVIRKYTSGLGPMLERELSVRIEHREIAQNFPLGTENPELAAIQAAQIYEALLLTDWPTVKLRYAREITLAIFWSSNPLACTYTTLYTIVNELNGSTAIPLPNRFPHRVADRRIIIADGDITMARALVFWIERAFPNLRVEIASSPDAALEMMGQRKSAMLLVSRDLPDARRLLDQTARTDCRFVVFTYGAFEHSDAIFASFTGVSGGYLLRRRPPMLLLEPVRTMLLGRSISPDEANRQVKKYFQALFQSSSVTGKPDNVVSLTVREQQILDHLSHGCLYKEIATKLNISIWTVHAHLKRIYDKLEVHTRTEAVVKYLQR